MQKPEYIPPTPDELATLRGRWHLTRTKLGDLIAADSRLVGRWLTGEREVHFGTLYALAARAEGARIEPETWRADLRLATARKPQERADKPQRARGA